MNWIPSQRTFLTAVATAVKFQKTYPDLFSGDRVEVNLALAQQITKATASKLDVHEDEKLLIRGYLLKKRGLRDYNVIISKISTLCWKRLTLCKELCHVLTDSADLFAQNPIEQIGSALTISKKSEAHGSLSSEEFCFVLAIELIIPPHRRGELTDLFNAGTSAYDLATLIKVPEWLITYYFKRTNLREFSDVIRKSIEDNPGIIGE